MAYSGGTASLFGEAGAGTLKLLVYLLLAVGLMVADHRGAYLHAARAWVGLLAEPLYWIASSPVRLASTIRDVVSSRQDLAAERDELRQELLIASARLHRLEAVQSENQTLRRLLLGKQGLNLNAQLADIADVELDPFRHRVTLDAGARHGVRDGLAVIDAGGVFGQVIDVGVLRSTVLLVTDPGHAVPVQVQRSGLRTIAFGTGERDRLSIPNLAQSADIREGDLLLTSGIGGRFPAGLPVATVTRLHPEESHLFIEADATPLAALDRSGQVLLVWNAATPEAGSGPPAALAPERVGPPNVPESGQ